MDAARFGAAVFAHPVVTGTLLSVAYITPIAMDATAGDPSSFLKELTGSAGAAVMGCFVISIFAKLVFVVIELLRGELAKRDEMINKLLDQRNKGG